MTMSDNSPILKIYLYKLKHRAFLEKNMKQKQQKTQE